MSFKDSIKAIKKIEQETAMRNRGGVINFIDGDEERLGFFGEKEKVERCICMMSVTLLDGVYRNMPDGMKDAVSALEDDIYNNMPLMKSRKKEKPPAILIMRDEEKEEDKFEDVINFITEKARPQKDLDIMMFAMMNGDKVYISSRMMALSKSVYQKIQHGDQSACDTAIDKLYMSILSVVGNYLTMHTPCTKKAVTEFFELMKKAELNVRMQRESNMIYPNIPGSDSPLIQ